MKKILIFLVALCFSLSTMLQAKLDLPSVFGDNMVLQQQSDAPIWGWANPTQTVSIVASWQPNDTVTTKVSGEGMWRTNLRTPKAGGPYTLKVFTFEGESIEFENVMLGEVWLCSGQSNMGWSAAENLVNKDEEIAAANHPNIRIFHVDSRTAATPQVDCDASWEKCTPQTMQYTSAVGYFFARQLKDKLDVPVGIIVSAWGGTPYETWTKKELIQNSPILQAKAPVGENEFRPNLTGTCYNQMIHPVIPFSIAGAIWYQGETNVGNPYYALGLQTMINGWRSDFGKEFPFYLVQIAPFIYKSANNEPALLREQQELATKLIPKTGLVVVSDLVDDVNDIHPIDKQNVGLRLANMALAETYNQQIKDYKSPTFKSMKVEKGKAVISFNNLSSDLVCKGDKIEGLMIAGADKWFVVAKGIIKENELIVSSDKVKNPVYVSFCFDDASVGNLFSKAGLPVAPFRSNPVKTFFE